MFTPHYLNNYAADATYGTYLLIYFSSDSDVWGGAPSLSPRRNQKVPQSFLRYRGVTILPFPFTGTLYGLSEHHSTVCAGGGEPGCGDFSIHTRVYTVHGYIRSSSSIDGQPPNNHTACTALSIR